MNDGKFTITQETKGNLDSLNGEVQFIIQEFVDAVNTSLSTISTLKETLDPTKADKINDWEKILIEAINDEPGKLIKEKILIWKEFVSTVLQADQGIADRHH